jgi:hypothetical protein
MLRDRKVVHYGRFDTTDAHRILSSGDAISRLDSVGKHEKKPGASLPAHRVKSRCTITALIRSWDYIWWES